MATLKGVAQHFGVTVQGMSDFAKKHLNEINADGEHAVLHRGKWHFDDIAIERLEQMRGYHDGSGVPLTNAPATVEEFKAVIAQLQNEIADLNNRVKKLESNKLLDLFGRVFKS